MNEQNDVPEENKEAILTPKTIEIFTEFAVTLKTIHIRLVTEGYIITADGIVPPTDKFVAEKPRMKGRKPYN